MRRHKPRHKVTALLCITNILCLQKLLNFPSQCSTPTDCVPQQHISRVFSTFCNEKTTPYALDSGLPVTVVLVVVLLTLAFRDPVSLEGPSPAPSCALLSKKFAHRSARDSLSLADVGSEKMSLLRDGELGVLWKGDVGSRKLPPEPPGRARPACSRCSSVQLR